MYSTSLLDLTRQDVEDERTWMCSQRVQKRGTVQPWRPQWVDQMSDTARWLKCLNFGAVGQLPLVFQTLNLVDGVVFESQGA